MTTGYAHCPNPACPLVGHTVEIPVRPVSDSLVTAADPADLTCPNCHRTRDIHATRPAPMFQDVVAHATRTRVYTRETLDELRADIENLKAKLTDNPDPRHAA